MSMAAFCWGRWPRQVASSNRDCCASPLWPKQTEPERLHFSDLQGISMYSGRGQESAWHFSSWIILHGEPTLSSFPQACCLYSLTLPNYKIATGLLQLKALPNRHSWPRWWSSKSTRFSFHQEAWREILMIVAKALRKQMLWKNKVDWWVVKTYRSENVRGRRIKRTKKSPKPYSARAPCKNASSEQTVSSPKQPSSFQVSVPSP